MAEPDCLLCEMAGYRACDLCGCPVIPPFSAFTRDLCAACLEDPAHAAEDVAVLDW